MRLPISLALVATIASAVGVACDSSNQHPELRVALEQSALSLRESIGVAATHVPTAAPVRAALVPGLSPLYAVGSVDKTSLTALRIDGHSGAVLSIAAAGTAQGLCDGSISLSDALGVAEERVTGEAIAVVPDDDVACAFEIQVLVGETLWEVKVASDGNVLEQELSDEYSGSEDPSE